MQKIELNKWLSPIATIEDLDSIRISRHTETCNWLNHYRGYQGWRDQSNTRYNLLWVHGKPGCGKTFLCAKLIDSLMEGDDPVAYFFAKAGDKDKTSALSILRTWCWQLLQHLPSEHNNVFKIYQKTAGLSPTLSTMKEVLLHLAKASKFCYVALDGLDECNTDKDLRYLMDVFAELTKVSKVLVTSRSISAIKEAIVKRFEGRSARYSIESKDVATDIAVWLRQQIELLELPDQRVKEKVTQKLLDSCDGMFLWVRLQLEALASLVSPNDIDSAISSLPHDLDATYETILSRISAQEKQRRALAYTSLQWISSVYRPLSIQELTTALQIKIDGENFSDCENLLNPSKLIPNICCGLVEIDGKGKFRLIHASVNDFLISRGAHVGILGRENSDESKHKHARTLIVRACLTCISYSDIDLVRSDSDQGTLRRKIEVHLQQYPFLEYAISNWFKHLDSHHDEIHSGLQASVKRFFGCQKNVVKWLQIYQYLQVVAEGPVFLFDPLSTRIWPFIKELWVSHFGQSPSALVDRWDRWKTENRFTLYCWEPICIAAFFDFVEVLQAEIDNGISVDFQDSEGFSAVHQAAHGDCLASMTLLVKHKANLQLQTSRGYGAVRYAARNGLEVLPVLLKAHSRIDLSDCATGRTALHEASASVFWHPMILDSLLSIAHRNKEVINQSDVDGQTALHYAAAINVASSLAWLKDRKSDSGASVPMPQWELFTPKSTVTLNRLQETWQDLNLGLLADKGLVETLKAAWKTFTFQSTTAEEQDTTQTMVNIKASIIASLLGAGADVNAQDHLGRSPLHVLIISTIDSDFAGIQRPKIMIPLQRIITASGVRFDMTDTGGRTPLMSAISRSSLFVSRMLLEAGAGPEDFAGKDLDDLRVVLNEKTTQRLSGGTPHSAASVSSPLTVFQTLHSIRSEPPAVAENLRSEMSDNPENWICQRYTARPPSALDLPVLISEPLSGCERPLRRITFAFEPASIVGRMDHYRVTVTHKKCTGMLRIMRMGILRAGTDSIEDGPFILEEQPDDYHHMETSSTWCLSDVDHQTTTEKARAWMCTVAAGDRIAILYDKNFKNPWFASVSMGVYTAWV